MKYIITLLTFILIGWNQFASAQVTGYQVYGDSMVGCQNSMFMYIITSGSDETGYVDINWGDGTTGTYPFQTLGPATYTSIEPTHVFAVPGTYEAHISVYSNTLGDYIDAGVTKELIGLSQSSCGYFYSSVHQNNPGYYYYQAPMDCIGANGEVTTVTPSYNYGGYIGLDPSNAPYTVSVNPDWLAENGYVQVTADQTITSFDINGLADNSQLSFEITCSVAAANPDFSVQYSWPAGFVAPLQTGTFYAQICNDACANSSDAAMSLNFPAGFVPNTTGLTNPVVTGNNLTFDILGLSDCINISIPFTFPGGTAAGTTICFDLTASNPNDTYPANNVDTTCSIVYNSYDPNSKAVDHPENIDPSTLETLEYMIHFQNDGNYNAVNVQVVDSISENLDMSSFKIINSKHGVATNVDVANRIITFTFTSCNLTPSTSDLEGSQGFVLYSIKEVAGLQEGDVIDNTAYIYFDYNAPVITNTAHNINSSLGIATKSIESITLYPNPAQNSVVVSGKDVESISIVDMAGKLVLEAKVTNNNSVNVEKLTNGIYTCVIISKNGVSQEKLVIRK